MVRRRSPHLVRSVVLALALAPSAAAQRSAPTPPGTAPAKTGATPGKQDAKPSAKTAGTQDDEVVVVQTHSEASSRQVFAAVDRNADDRLDIFEFTRALSEDVDAHKLATAAFRSADGDHDGFLSWPEFDQRLQEHLRLRGEFRYRPARRVGPTRPQSPTAAADGPIDERVAALWTVLDTDHSGRVSREEFASLLTAAGMQPAAMVRFVDADADGDDELDRKELARLMTMLPNMPRMSPPTSSAQGFAPAWRRADKDGDGEVSVAELQVALRQHEIYLGRWADKIVADADRSGDRRLGPAEVLATEPRK